jgi:UDP-N-acetylglucosamine 4,6-dehydratase
MYKGTMAKDTDMEYVTGKTILVTGGTGSIGSEIVRILAKSKAKTIRILSNDENGVFELSKELEGSKFRFFIGDVRDKDRMILACEGVDIVFHAAALKHVPLCEYNPAEAVKTNVIGTQNVIEACLANDVEKLIFISTDKAVEPVNTMGATKLLAEKLVVDANFYKGLKRTVFSIVRFGNVLASRGSVVPLFIEQAKTGGPITLTNVEMTRFIMYIDEAVGLIFQAAGKAKGGEIYTFKMPVARMKDLAEVVRDKVAKETGKPPVQIETMGVRAGESMHEALMTNEEAARAKVHGQLIEIPSVNPNIPGRVIEQSAGGSSDKVEVLYRSELVPPMGKDKLREMVQRLKLV